MILERPLKAYKSKNNLEGMRFGRLVAKRYVGVDSKSGRAMWECLCDCGKTTLINARNLRSGVTSSCGCLRHDTKPNLTHGCTGTVEWGVYHTMKQRCFDKNLKNFHRYGGRGITCCEAIKNSFAYFLEIVGIRPSSEMELDRIDNDLHYSCGKCTDCLERGWAMNMRWATPKQGARNRSNNHFIVVFGSKMTVAEAAETYNIQYDTLLMRINRQKLSPDDAVTRPLRCPRF